MQLIQEKLTVPHPFGLVSRPRLIKLLTDSLNSGSATVIYARAGMGKTALVSQLAGEGIRKTAWFKVDASDSHWRTFFNYLANATDLQIPGFLCGHFARSVANSTLQDMLSCAEFFVFDLIGVATEPLAIVFEDLHLIFDDEWLEPFLSRLIALLPSNIHVLITSRSQLPTPLWRFRSKQLLSVVEESDLLFTLSETEDLCDALGLSGHATTLWQRSAGRAAVLSALVNDIQMERPGPAGEIGERRQDFFCSSAG